MKRIQDAKDYINNSNFLEFHKQKSYLPGNSLALKQSRIDEFYENKSTGLIIKPYDNDENKSTQLIRRAYDDNCDKKSTGQIKRQHIANKTKHK